jgi:decaprenylphospho-beta-D-erythro-pentofuranosid-2-ulose 2-reductase
VQVMTVKPGFVRTKMTEGMDLPEVLLAEPDQVATAIYKGMIKKRNVVYTLWMWRYIMLIIKHIPEFIFKKMEL